VEMNFQLTLSKVIFSLSLIVPLLAKTTWLDCLKSAFYNQAKEEFSQIERNAVYHEDIGRVFYDCDQKTRAKVDTLFGKYFNNLTLMQDDNTCRKMSDNEQLSMELMAKNQVFEPLCQTEPQHLFDDQYNGGTPVSIEREQGFIDALGLPGKESCSNFDEFRKKMDNCNNSVAYQRDLSLSDYLVEFCVGYQAQRSCYADLIQEYCSDTYWKIPYDRTRVPAFEEVCTRAHSESLKSTILFPITMMMIMFNKIL